MPDRPRYTIWIVPHTHWDRAWYYPFETFRGMLVELVDRLLDIMDHDPSYRAFSLDGQTVVLDDYLEIRPEQHDRLKKHIRSGRLAVGPWYVLPDAYLVSGEALVRNLFMGRKTARRFGREMDAGNLPDPFGFPATMPAVLAGFGLDNMICTRGIPPDAAALGVVFRWKAPDGSSVMLCRQIPNYCNLAGWGVGGDYPMDGEAFNEQWVVDKLEKEVVAAEAAGLNVRTLLMNNGCDHLPAQPNVPAMIRRARKAFPRWDIRQGTFADYVASLRKENPSLKTYSGEMHSGLGDNILSGVFSARMWIKQENFACQRMLECLVEPLDALLGAAMGAPPAPFVNYAWRELLKVHPHDDICGCSVDEVHEDNATQFRHVRRSAEAGVRVGMRQLGERVREQASVAGKELVIAFNPVPAQRGCLLSLAVHHNWKAPEGGGIRLLRADGRAVPAVLSDGRIEFYDEQLPAGGYAAYVVTSGEPAEPSAELKAAGDTIENARLKAVLRDDGSVDLYDKRTAKWYRKLNRFEDTADAGDEYDYSPIDDDQGEAAIRGGGGRRRAARVHCGRAEVSVDLTVLLPAGLTKGRTARTRRQVAVPVTVTIRLAPDIPRLEFTTTLNNTAADHRFRVLFPTGARTATVRASSHFDIVERPTDPTKGTAGHFQPTVATHHMDEFVAAERGGRGGLVVSRGLPEYEARGGRGGVELALTLLRCVGWLSRNDIVGRPRHAGPALRTPGAQCPGIHTFEYAFIPYNGGLVDSGAAACAREYTIPATAVLCGPRKPMTSRPTTPMPLEQSWVTLKGRGLVLSALKRAENGWGLAVRIYNISSTRQRGEVKFCRPIGEAHRARMDETPLEKHPFSGAGMALNLKPKEILTLLIKFR